MSEVRMCPDSRSNVSEFDASHRFVNARQRDKGVVSDGEIVEEVSGLVPSPFHANQFLMIGVALFPFPLSVRELLCSLSH